MLYSNKANNENPTLEWTFDDGTSVELRKSGDSGKQELSFVFNNSSGSNSYYSLIDPDDSRRFIKSTVPTNHQSTSSTYGLGDQSNYGHVKIVGNLNRNTHVGGEALAAYQGYLLNQNKLDKTNPELTWNIKDSNFPVKLRRGGDSGSYELFLDVNGNNKIIVENSGTAMNNLLDMIYGYHLSYDGSNKYINITFNCSNGMCSFLLLGYFDNYFLSVNLEKVTSSLSSSNITYSILSKPNDSGRTLSQVWIVKNSDNYYRLKLQYTEAVSVLDIISIAGDIRISSVSTSVS